MCTPTQQNIRYFLTIQEQQNKNAHNAEFSVIKLEHDPYGYRYGISQVLTNPLCSQSFCQS
jgi:hypothetical protein